MKQYLELVAEILETGEKKQDRTGVGTRSLFGKQIRFDLALGFPLLTTKKIHFKSVIHELLWFIRGDTNVGYLNENGVRIWNEWADENGELGPIYGKQWRAWEGVDGVVVDQLANVVDEIQRNPSSRRLLVSAWNVGSLPQMKLPPCHLLFQFYVTAGRLSCQLYQRSADVFLGVPFNIASYALLIHIVAQVCGLRVGEFVHTFGDVHLYESHVKQAREQITREPGSLPQLRLDKVDDLFEFRYEHIHLLDYHSAPHIPAPVAV